ncbi:MAG: hypothetical protein AB1489_12685 [Acidobacteriota bacterium]
MNLLLKQLKLENVSDAIKIINSAGLIYPYPINFNFFTFFRHVKAYNISFQHSFIGYRGGKAIGAVLNCGNTKEQDLYTYVWAISPELSGTRTVTDLTRFALDHIKKRKFKRVICEIVRESDHALWQKLGFRKTRELHSLRLNTYQGDATSVQLRPCELADIEPILENFRATEPPWVKRCAQLHSYQDELKKFLLLDGDQTVGYILLNETETTAIITELRYPSERIELGRAALAHISEMVKGKPLFCFYVPAEDNLFEFYRTCGFETFMVHDELQLVFELNDKTTPAN